MFLLILVPVVIGLIITAAYYNLANISYQKGVPSGISQSTTAPTPLSHLQISFPKNRTYEKTQIHLNVTVSNRIAQITYSLDGGKNWTLSENKTIWAGDGSHNIIFYAFDTTSKLVEYRTVYFEVQSPKFEQQPLTRAEAINDLTSQGFTIQKGSNVTIEQYYGPRELPILTDFIYVGWSNLILNARNYNTSVIYEYIYDTVVFTETHHYDLRFTVFYVEQPNTPFKLFAWTYEGPKWINGP